MKNMKGKKKNILPYFLATYWNLTYNYLKKNKNKNKINK
jgi:hypothetical protein